MNNPPNIMIMGVGNVLLTDEGAGVHILKEFAEGELPENVELIEAGTAGLELAHLIEETDFLIIVDAVNARTKPGDVFRFKPEDITIMPEEVEVSFHQVGILEVLSIVGILGNSMPQTMVYGVQPKTIEWGLELTEEIAAALPKIKGYILKDIAHINSEHAFMPLESKQ